MHLLKAVRSSQLSHTYLSSVGSNGSVNKGVEKVAIRGHFTPNCLICVLLDLVDGVIAQSAANLSPYIGKIAIVVSILQSEI